MTYLDMDWVGDSLSYSLGWFLHSPVGIESLELVLHSTQRVSKLPVIEGHYGLFNPLKQL